MTNSDGIVLLAKQPGPTSFSTLHSVKKALNTTKVGHTGTLDSFAQGLLVVCTGRLTRLAGNIIEFDKSYKAVIHFGQETDNLEYTGNVIKNADCPTLEDLNKAITQFTGQILQQPPAFSAIHVDGIRASDLARSGTIAQLPERPVTIYKAELLDTKLSDNGKVEYALVDFSVSKGTYIRSLARDIGHACGSAAHLTGLYRTRVGNFKIEDAAGFGFLQDFSIENAIQDAQKFLKQEELKKIEPEKKGKFVMTQKELDFQEEIRQKMQTFTADCALLCGFKIIHLNTSESLANFQNGRPLRSAGFDTDLHTLPVSSITAVFSANEDFAGLIEKDQTGRIHYKFVIN